jgi:hypothetical protein
MSYVDYQILGHELTTVQSETSAADVKTYTFPVSVEVIAFGCMITEDFVAHDIDSVFSIDLLDSIGGTRTEKATITLSGADANLKSGDGDKAAQTAITADTDLDNGDVVYADRDNFPFEVLPGQSIVLEHKTASGSAGGAASAFALIRVGGERAQLARVWMYVD